MAKKTSEAQIKATRAWESRNKEKNKIDNYRRMARLFIRKYATEEDIKELIIIFGSREDTSVPNENGNR